jgi:adenosylmethionine-8-amino-7-oxononanoate aminotransferase
LMVYPMGGTIDGVRGDHVLLAPPFISTTADIEEIVSLLDASINSAIQLTRA